MMTDHDMLAIEARKVKLTQVSNKDGNWYDVTFQIHPDDAINTELAQWPLRQRVSLVVARIREDGAGDKEQPSEAAPERVKDTADWSDAKRRMVQQSGIVRKEPAFHNFIAKGWPIVWAHPRHDGKTDEEKAAYFLHTSCQVKSCRDLEPDAPSGQRFRDLMWHYGQAEDQQRQREAGRT